MIYDREEFERDLARVKHGETGAIYWASEDIASAFRNVKNAIALGRAAESDKAVIAAAAADVGRLAAAVRTLIDQQLSKKPEDE